MSSQLKFKGRKKPYTAIGIARIKCAVRGCNNKSKYQWNSCANGGQYMGICQMHDIALNDLVLRFFGFDRVNQRMERYVESL